MKRRLISYMDEILVEQRSLELLGLENTVRKGRVPSPIVCFVFLAFAASLVWLAFLAISFALATPLCCADDAAISLVAKSVAEGHGYTMPINFIGESGSFRFDPGISTGATLILPAAAALALFGNHPWIPGLTSAVISIGLLCWLGYLLLRRFGAREGSSYGLTLVVLLYLATSGPNFVHWYALIGEIPAALLIILAAFYVTEELHNRNKRFISGLLAGLAMQSKLLAFLALPALAIFALWGAQGVGRTRKDWQLFAYFIAGFLIPNLAFETWRLCVLGIHGYVEWFHQLMAFMNLQVPGVRQNADRISVLIDRAASNSASALKANGHTPFGTMFCLIFSTVIAWITLSKSSGKVIGCLMSIAVANLAWWVLFSNGWPRYELIGMCLSAATMASVMLWRTGPTLKALAVLLAAFSIGPIFNPSQVLWSIRGPGSISFGGPSRIDSLEQILTPVMKDDGGAVLIGSWWASLVEAEFLLKQNVKIVGFNRLYSIKEDNLRGFLLINKKWDAFANMENNPEFGRFRENECNKLVNENADFVLYGCAASVFKSGSSVAN